MKWHIWRTAGLLILFSPPTPRKLRDVKSRSYREPCGRYRSSDVLSRNKISLAICVTSSRWTKSGREKRDSVNNLAAQASDVAARCNAMRRGNGGQLMPKGGRGTRGESQIGDPVSGIRERAGEGRRQTAINKARNPTVMRQSAAVTVATT